VTDNETGSPIHGVRVYGYDSNFGSVLAYTAV
jgi:hypothetical protein